jgi:transposase
VTWEPQVHRIVAFLRARTPDSSEKRLFSEQVELLDTIPGVNRRTAETLIAEIGVDMSRFPTHRHLASWA